MDQSISLSARWQLRAASDYKMANEETTKRNINSPQSDCPTRPATRSKVAQDPSRCRCPRLLPRIGPWRIDRPSNRPYAKSSNILLLISLGDTVRTKNFEYIESSLLY